MSDASGHSWEARWRTILRAAPFLNVCLGQWLLYVEFCTVSTVLLIGMHFLCEAKGMLWVSPFQVFNQSKQSLVWLQQALCSNFCQLFYFKQMLNQTVIGRLWTNTKLQTGLQDCLSAAVLSHLVCLSYFLRECVSWEAVSYLKLPVSCSNSSISGKPTPALSRKLD